VFFERSDETDNLFVLACVAIVGPSCRMDDAVPEIREVYIVQSSCGYLLVDWSAQLLRGFLDRELFG
jgi:hypothetical protein